MQNSRIIRKFERFLFKGIPEQPESIYERNGNPYVDMRHTGKPQAISTVSKISPDSKVIGEFIYDFENRTEQYISEI